MSTQEAGTKPTVVELAREAVWDAVEGCIGQGHTHRAQHCANRALDALIAAVREEGQGEYEHQWLQTTDGFVCHKCRIEGQGAQPARRMMVYPRGGRHLESFNASDNLYHHCQIAGCQPVTESKEA